MNQHVISTAGIANDWMNEIQGALMEHQTDQTDLSQFSGLMR